MSTEHPFTHRKKICWICILAVIAVMCGCLISQFTNAKNSKALCEAIEMQNNRKLESLLEEGADANWSPCTVLSLPIAIITEWEVFSTPLNTACEHGNVYAVEKLLEYGADPNKRILGGFAAIEAVYNTIAGRDARFEIIPLLLEHGAELTYRLSPVITRHVAFKEISLATDESAMQSIVLLQLYTDTPENLSDDSGRTLLAKCNSAIVATWLIREGADVNAADENGNTPLMYAVEYRYRKVVEVLIANGADLALKNQEGKTAYDLAVENGYDELLELLSLTN